MISVIIPVYNVKNYIERCLNSVISQTYKELEIIAVDDGSTDGSGEICDIYAQKDNRIRVIHQSNHGQSYARNAALDIAGGDYIAFVDSDDFIHPQMYEILTGIMTKTDADMVIADKYTVNESEYAEFKFENFPDEYIKKIEKVSYEGKEELFTQMDRRSLQLISQWNRIYKKKVFHDVRFPVGKIHEEIYVVHKELWNCEKIVFADIKLYAYLQRNGSTMHSQAKGYEGILNGVEGYEKRIEFFEERFLPQFAVSTKFMLLEYLRNKFEMIYEEGYSPECEKIGQIFKEKYFGYIRAVKEAGILSFMVEKNELYKIRDMEILAKDSYKYYNHLVKRKKSASVKSFIKRIFRGFLYYKRYN